MGLFNWGKNGDSMEKVTNKIYEEVVKQDLQENEKHEFDLNIEKILENWEVYHAIREIISNALDEQILTNTHDIEIKKIKDVWHIIDYGRGLNYHDSLSEYVFL